jgi:tRNA(adenine34) deaminase
MKPELMLKAIEVAKNSDKDIPIGAIIVKNGEIIASAHNQREKDNITTSHAEILAIQRANEKLKNWRLNDCEMYVTLEPCPMCASAIIQARISKVYFGAYDTLNGALESKCDMRKIMNYNNLEVFGGIKEEECTKILKDYFLELR